MSKFNALITRLGSKGSFSCSYEMIIWLLSGSRQLKVIPDPPSHPRLDRGSSRRSVGRDPCGPDTVPTACGGNCNYLYYSRNSGDSMPELHHDDNLGTARFVTSSCCRRLQLLNDNQIRNVFLKYLKGTCNKYSILIFGYVIMPEHVHLVLYPQHEVALAPVIGELKSKSAREILSLVRSGNSRLLEKLTVTDRQQFWQKRCYDHNCRTSETVKEKIEYCHKNPVTRGLVKSPAEWLYSSSRWYSGMDSVVLEIDCVDL